MEPTLNSSDNRLVLLRKWLQGIASQHQLALDTLQPASADASFRRYFRVQAGTTTLIVMDAPPDREDCGPFLHVSKLLQQAGLRVPAIHAENRQDGFLLLSDLGEQTYFQAITAGLSDLRLQRLYREALGALVRLQHASCNDLPQYDAARLHAELEVFPEWYVDRHCGVQLTDADRAVMQDAFALLVDDNVKQPTVLVHRDFHSPNLMVGSDDADPGIIDYQDALCGPITYDIASLVMDARTTWEEPQQLDWAIRYWEAAKATGLPVPEDFASFHRAYEWMGLQRNLRILGVFARLSHRDGKHHYLDHLPRVSAYVRQVASRYVAFGKLLRLIDKIENRQIITGYTF